MLHTLIKKNFWDSLKNQVFKLSAPRITFIIIAFFLVSLSNHYRNRLTQKLDWIEIIETQAYDLRFLIRGAKSPSDKIGILAIDEASIQKFGQWPFPRKVYKKPLENLKKRGVKVIGFDVVYSEAERTNFQDSIPLIKQAVASSVDEKNVLYEDYLNNNLEMLKDYSPGDLTFAESMQKFGKVVQGFFYLESGKEHFMAHNWTKEVTKAIPSQVEFAGMEEGVKKTFKDYPHITTYGFLTNTEALAAATPYMGFFNNESQSQDGKVRRVVLLKIAHPKTDKNLKPLVLPSLSLKVAEQYLDSQIVTTLDQDGFKKIQLIPQNSDNETIDIPILSDTTGSLLVNHYGPNGTFPHISFADAYENKLPKKLPEILLVGSTATGIPDLRPSPFSKNFNGVEHHAAAVENIIQKDFMKRKESMIWYEIGIVLFSGLLLTLSLQKTTALRSLVIMITFLAALFFIDYYFIFSNGNWLYIGTLYLQSFTIYISITLYNYFSVEKERKKVKNAFQHYLNPSVINEILEHPEKLKLGGDSKELTVFFSDVRGFTTISESLDPQSLTKLLNEYFTPMTQIVLDSDGLLDKYIGDAIMAIWGAPLDQPDQADRALISSIQMIEALKPLQEKWLKEGFPRVDIGIGLNTGPMTVGNLGGDQRFNYTVLGDAVNLASRLEGITKEYGTKIVCSEMTVNALQDKKRYNLRELDLIQVKGKTKPVRIYDIPIMSERYDSKIESLIERFNEGIYLYRERKFDEAIMIFAELYQKYPEDATSRIFLDRCTYMRENPPDEDWNGVWIMKTK